MRAKSPKLIRTRKGLERWRNTVGKRLVGFVPTMGALHEGHLSLVSRAKKENDLVVVSIFVNPTQFGPQEDFRKYPRTLNLDLALLESVGVDVVFAPRVDEVYPSQSDVRVLPPKRLTHILEGRFRSGHFEGVATVVLKLFHLVQATRAYFGEKDFQQILVVEEMVKALFLKTAVVRCPTIREASGLALSSRNRYLKDDDRVRAGFLWHVLSTSPSLSLARRKLSHFGFKIDYLEIWNDDLSRRQGGRRGRWLAAVRWKGIRLIDNVKRGSTTKVVDDLQDV